MIDYKNCPFCKKEIPKNSVECSFCKRILIEKFITTPSQYQDNIEKETINTKQDNYRDEKKSIFEKNINIFDNIIKRIKKFNIVDNWKILLIVIAIIVFIVGIYNREKNKQSYGYPQSNSKYVPKAPAINFTPETPANNNYYSLPNGTIIHSQPNYLDGLGELKIDNGTDRNAVAKLIDAAINKSIYTVYIRAKNIFKIKGISDGTYKLYFVSGNNWDKTNRKFLVNSSYSKFKDNFEFITTEMTYSDKIQTKYSVFEITLHPVMSGTAKTDNISESEFDNY